MPEIKFGEGATDLIVEQFDMTVDDDGFVVDEKTGERVKDPFGETVNIENVGGIVHLESYEMTVNDEGRVLDSKGDPVSSNFDSERYKHTEALVHIRNQDAILRTGISNVDDFVEAEETYEKTRDVN